MDKGIYTKISNAIKSECEYVMKNEKNKDKKIEKMDTLFNLKKILDNYDDLEPLLREYFANKAGKERFDR